MRHRFSRLIPALASLGSLSILALTNALSGVGLSDRLPLLLSVVVYIAGLFLLPSLILGCVSPIVVKLSLTDLHRSGTTVGKIYAWSSIGSIVGTFATGFWLISWFGTRTVVLLVAGVLMLMAIWFLTDGRRVRAATTAAVALVLFLVDPWACFTAGEPEPECLLETNYFCISARQRDG